MHNQPKTVLDRLVLLLVSCAVLLTLFWGLRNHVQRPLTLVDLLPRETVAVIESKNIALIYRQIQQGLTGTLLSRNDFSAFARRFDLTSEQVDRFSAIIGAFNSLSHREGMLSLLSRNSIISLFSLHPGEHIELEQLPKRLVFLQYLSPQDDLQHLFFPCFGKILQREQLSYQGQPLTRLAFAGGDSITYFTHMGVLAWAFEERVLHPCINQLLQQLLPLRGGIQQQMGYSRLKKYGGKKTDAFIYLRLAALQSLFGCTPTPSFGDRLPCPDDLALFFSSLAQGKRFALVALADQEQIAAYKSKHRLRDAVENAPLGRLSTDTAFALWTNWFKPMVMWQQLVASDFSPLRMLMEGWSTDFQKALGLSPTDFFSLFGSDFALYIDQKRAAKQYPRSLVSASIEVLDGHQVGTLLAQMTEKLQKVEVRADGLDIVTLMLADGLLQPAYALVNHHLILADSAELIERFYHKVTQPEKGINPSRGLRIQRSNFFLFLRTGDMVEWLLPVLKTIGKEFGGHTGNSNEDWLLFHPFVLAALSELSSIETTRIRAYLQKNEMFFEMISRAKSN
nr:hypothetical protein [uncultured Desulfobulbus sp.]